MDRMWTSGEVAQALGTSPPRVIRAADRLFGRWRQSGQRRYFTTAQVTTLIADLGAAPPHDTLDREELFILSAILHHPLGLRSARAVATAAGVSPTTAARALPKLQSAQLLVRSATRVVEGRPHWIHPWRIDQESPAWHAVAPAVRKVLPPVHHGELQPADRVPRRLWHLFWNADPSRLTAADDGRYLAARILQSGDPEAIAWMVDAISPDDIRAASRTRGLDPSRRALASNVAAVP